jgi:serine/threonine protein kinase
VSTDLQPGQLLDGRFEITDLINRSGMTCIFKANDRANGATVAIKAPPMQFESDRGSYSRFQREKESGTSLTHPYILRSFEADFVGNRTRSKSPAEFARRRVTWTPATLCIAISSLNSKLPHGEF